MTGRPALLVALVVSLVVHALVIGIGELLSPGGSAPLPRAEPTVEYRTVETDKEDPKERDRRETQEGKSISLETPDPAYRPYFTALTRAIDSSWGAPVLGANDPSEGTVMVEFTLGAGGELLAVSVARSSGVRGMDLAAVKAVKGATPFEKIPPEIATRELTIRALFVYD
jgi:TonB family protein